MRTVYVRKRMEGMQGKEGFTGCAKPAHAGFALDHRPIMAWGCGLDPERQ